MVKLPNTQHRINEWISPAAAFHLKPDSQHRPNAERFQDELKGENDNDADLPNDADNINSVQTEENMKLEKDTNCDSSPSSPSSSFIDVRITSSTTTATHIAARLGRVEVIDILVNRGADLNAVDGASWSPLHHAVDAGQLEATKRLLELGVKDDGLSGDGYTPYSLARKKEIKNIIRTKVRFSYSSTEVWGENHSG